MTCCTAAQCAVPAAAAVRWLDLRRARSRTQPVCEGHRQALTELTRQRPDPLTQVTWVSLDFYHSNVSFSLADLLRP